jgi:hypothetical protein
LKIIVIRYYMKLLLALLIPCLFAFSTETPKKTHQNKQSDGLSADSILHKSALIYSKLNTYLDSGKSVSTFHTERPRKTAKYFKTAYSRNGQFNFEYYEAGKSNSLYVINRNADIVKTWWGVSNKTLSPATLLIALAGAAGVSSGTTYFIPSLLLTNDFKKTNLYQKVFSPELKESEEINGVDCYQVKCVYIKKNLTVWIAKKDFLIRKIETESTIDPAKTIALMNKVDSEQYERHKNMSDTATKRKDSTFHANIKRVEAVSALVMGDRINQPYTVTTVYNFFPYHLKKAAPELFIFRPNREVNL